MAGNLVIHPNQSVRTEAGLLKYGDEDRLYDLLEEEDIDKLEQSGILVDEDHVDVLAFASKPQRRSLKRKAEARAARGGDKKAASARKERSTKAAKAAKEGGTKGAGGKKAKKEGEEAQTFTGPFRVAELADTDGGGFAIRDVNDQVVTDEDGAVVFDSQEEAEDYASKL